MSSLVKELVEVAKGNLESIALVCDGSSYTYRDLFNSAFGIREKLKNSERDFFGVYTDNNFHTYASILGILLARKAFVPLNHKFPTERLKSIIKSTQLDEAFCCSNSVEVVQGLGIKSIEIESIEESSNWNLDEEDSNEFSYVLFTSGSTGEPKGIPIRQNNLKELIHNIFSSLPMESTDKVLQTFELSFDVSIACTFMTWSKGATLYISPLNGIIALDAYKTIVENELTYVCIAPSAITYLRKLKLLKEFPVPSVVTTVFTGEALPEIQVKDWMEAAKNSKVYNAYGPTENTVWSFVHEYSKNTVSENGLIPIGKPVNGFNYMVNDPIDGLGELWVSGKQVFEGYWENPQKTKEVLVNKNNVLWYRTGDIVKVQENNDLMYVNRLDNQVQINGYRVELGEVEFKISKALNNTPCVVYLESKDSFNYLVVILERENNISKTERSTLMETLPFYMQPKEYYNMKSFPVNTNSKIDRKRIKQLINDRD